jgi:hypothetical protein
MRVDKFKKISSIECTNATQVSKIHPNKKCPADDVGVGYKTPVA